MKRHHHMHHLHHLYAIADRHGGGFTRPIEKQSYGFLSRQRRKAIRDVRSIY